MSDSDIGGRRRSTADDLPPYAPRPAQVPQAAVGETAAPAQAAEAPVPPDVADEAAAFAEAREQGIDDAAWPPPADHDATPMGAVPRESEPATVQLPIAGGPVAGPDQAVEQGSPRATPDLDLPKVDDAAVTGAAVRGERRERSRRARTRRAAATLEAEHRDRRVDPVRVVLLGLGELLITLGVLLGLFVVYELWITDLLGERKQEAVSQQMEQRWSSSAPTTAPSADTVAPPPAAQEVDPAQRGRKYATVTGEGFANLYIPVFGADYVFAVVEGTTTDDLYGNPGHYDDTQYPGEFGNFAVAGHRVSKGSPFNALDTLNSCDAIVIETQDEWFVYRVLPMQDEVTSWNPVSRAQCAAVQPLTDAYAGLPGREIVDPSDYAQVLPIPHVDATGPDALAAATQRIITLTTCHPQFSDAERMIVHGVLTKTYAKAPGFLPPELGES